MNVEAGMCVRASMSNPCSLPTHFLSSVARHAFLSSQANSPSCTGTIDFEEFVEMMTGKMGDRDSPEEIRRVFKLFDDDETGRISFRNLKRVARELGENMTDEELQEMINKADLDGDGEVNEEEFMRIMTYKHSFKADGK